LFLPIILLFGWAYYLHGTALASGFHLPGEYRYVWDAGNRAAGMYFVRLRAGEEKHFEKLLLLK
jgi:hypothetical protein